MTYRTIVADPPWRYTKTGARVEGRMKGRGGGAERHYETMTCAEVAALPVRPLTADQAHLYLWVTNPKLYGDETGTPLDIVQTWGFEYTTLLTWVKTGAPGMGFYFRGATEHVIFATRNKCPIAAEIRESNVFTAPRRGHSEKPDSFLDLVERVSPAPRIELFARRQRFGWDTWGNEALEHVELTA